MIIILLLKNEFDRQLEWLGRKQIKVQIFFCSNKKGNYKH